MYGGPERSSERQARFVREQAGSYWRFAVAAASTRHDEEAGLPSEARSEHKQAHLRGFAASVGILRVRLRAKDGPPGDRTRDTVIKSHVLYH